MTKIIITEDSLDSLKEAHESEMKEVLDVLLKVSPKHEKWVMKNWGYIYGKDKGNSK